MITLGEILHDLDKHTGDMHHSVVCPRHRETNAVKYLHYCVNYTTILFDLHQLLIWYKTE